MYAAGVGAVKLEEMMRLQEVEKAVADECQKVFGRPAEMQALPIVFAFSDGT